MPGWSPFLFLLSSQLLHFYLATQNTGEVAKRNTRPFCLGYEVSEREGRMPSHYDIFMIFWWECSGLFLDAL